MEVKVSQPKKTSIKIASIETCSTSPSSSNKNKQIVNDNDDGETMDSITENDENYVRHFSLYIINFKILTFDYV